MKKQQCDFCVKEIDYELSDEIELYNYASEKTEFEADMCEKCKKKILIFLNDFKQIENNA